MLFLRIMAETQEIRGTKQDSSFPTDLLQRFICGGGAHFPAKLKEESPEHDGKESIELSLGLSLNGRFGVDPRRVVADNGKNKLIRASSVANFVSFPETEMVSPSLYSPLTRTCSLPAETEEERRKRKELQSLRRLEAKRKRVEKLKNVRVVKGKTEENWEGNGRNLVNGSEVWRVELKPIPPPQQFSSQGSLGSQGSGSSGISDFESQPFSGPSKDAEIKSPASEQSAPQQIERKSSVTGPNRSTKVVAAGVGPASDNSSVRSSNGDSPDDETLKAMFADMPCVSTKVEGPDGKKIEGFLYRYRKGEEVRIVCVCHGSFLTPAEFVKHGGGGDVEHPLRHIVVNPSSFC